MMCCSDCSAAAALCWVQPCAVWPFCTLTNFKTIQSRIKRLKDIETMQEDGTFDVLPKKEVIALKKEMEKLQKNLDILENSQDEEEQVLNDKMIHYTIVEASGNRLVIANYLALAKIMDNFIRETRSKIMTDERNSIAFQGIHRRLVEAICSRDLELGKKALDEHFVYICKNLDT